MTLLRSISVEIIHQVRHFGQKCSFEQHVELQDLLSLVGSRVTDIADLVHHFEQKRSIKWAIEV
jgi:hypothetical protein